VAGLAPGLRLACVAATLGADQLGYGEQHNYDDNTGNSDIPHKTHLLGGETRIE
jgi:hypothetical protein